MKVIEVSITFKMSKKLSMLLEDSNISETMLLCKKQICLPKNEQDWQFYNAAGIERVNQSDKAVGQRKKTD